MTGMKYRNVVWDWNGTLLNDVQVGVDTLNDMLGRRGIRRVTVDEYKELFGFPVLGFYQKIGFDLEKESFHNLSLDFVETYDKYAVSLALNADVPDVLAEIRRSGRKQYILSALREDLLQQMLRDFGIDSCFDKACGSDNIYAAGKIERGQRMVQALAICPEETLMIGDSVHDAEVAQALGFGCVLFSGGHNSEQRLLEKAPVIRRIGELRQFLEMQ